MRAILIDPIKREVTEVQIHHALEGDTLGDLQKAVGGYIELAHRFDNGDDLFVNEEGLYKYSIFFDIGAHSPFAGSGIIVGHNSAGNTTPAKSSIEDIKSRIRWQVRP